jgi:hypothetical protein
MVHKILNRFTGKILFECECENLKTCVEIAVKKKINLDYAFFDRASLDGASFYGASLNYASFDSASLDGASFYGASLDCAIFDRASLDGASFDGASLGYAFFDRASLDGASFDGAFLDGSSFDRAKNIIVIEWRGFSFHTQKEKTKIGCEYRSNKEWLEMSKEKAVELGIKEEDFEDYRKILKMAIELLK